MAEPTVSDLLRDLGDSSRDLIKKEIRLAKAEVLESVTVARSGVIWLGAALVLALMALVALPIALILALDVVLQPWAAALIVAGALLACAGILALVGAKRLKRTNPVPERALESVREDVEWVKHQLS